MLQHIFECEILTDGEFNSPDFAKGVNISCEIIADKYMVYASDISDEKLAELTAKYNYLGTREIELPVITFDYEVTNG